MNHTVYRDATLRALASGTSPEVVLSGLQKTLARRGHTKLYGAVLKEVLASLSKKEADGIAIILLARKEDEGTYAEAIKAFVHTAHATGTRIVVDESIVGGFIAQTTTTKRDQSYKGSLVALYRSLTAG
ncbi:F0F1 ATP synthase subunit delta [Patescibacteria group bacterium]|nr:F0F1 ATP synthase subunit delta [Patescibacteria group bacterium]